MATEWFINADGQQHGPVPPSTLRQLAQEGAIGRDTLVKMGANGNWTPAAQVEGLLDPPEQPTHSTVWPQPVPDEQDQALPHVTKNPGKPNTSPVQLWVMAGGAFLCGVFGMSYGLSLDKNDLPDLKKLLAPQDPKIPGKASAPAPRRTSSIPTSPLHTKPMEFPLDGQINLEGLHHPPPVSGK